MLPEDAFLRRLPKTLNPTERFRLNALLFSADTVVASYESLVSLTSLYGESITDIKRPQLVQIFTFAWSIVDHLHVCRQILMKLGIESQTTTNFINETESASLLRNKMDHLNTNIDNLTKAKTPSPPLFGSLTYLFVSKLSEEKKPVEGAFVLISTGSWDHSLNMTASPAFNGPEIRFPVSLFQLEAFDLKLAIEKAARALEVLIVEVNKTVEESCRRQTQKIAEEKGIPVETLLENYGGDVLVFLACKFGDDGKIVIPATPRNTI